MASQVFDSHVHTFPDKIAPATVEHIASIGGITPAFDGTRSNLLSSMQEAGIDGSLNCPIASRVDQVEGINAWAINNNVWPVLSLGTMHPDYADPLAEFERLKTNGIRGIKMHPEYQDFALEENRLDTVWDAVERTGLIVLIHAGADINFDPPHRTSPETVAEFHNRHPEITLVAAHLGGWQMWNEVERHIAGSDVFLDLAFVLPYMSSKQAERIINTHGAEHVLFGSDTPWASQKEALQQFLDLPLSEKTKEFILWENAMRLWGPE